MRKGFLFMTLGLMALAAPMFGTVTIDFGTGNAGTGGTYTLTGSNASGSGIPIEEVTISGAPSNNGVYAVYGTATGSNTNTTGTFAGCVRPGDSPGSTGCGDLSFNTATNFIDIVGYIPGLGITTSETLLSGTFSSFQADANGLHNATGPDTKATDLLAALGLPANTQFSFFGFSLTTSGVNADGVGSIISTDIRNTSVPEPASTLLLGTVLCGVALLLRKRTTKA